MSDLMKVILAYTSFLVPFFLYADTKQVNTNGNGVVSRNKVVVVQPYNEVGGIRHYWNNDYYTPQYVHYDYTQNPYYLTPRYDTPGIPLNSTNYYNKTVKVSR